MLTGYGLYILAAGTAILSLIVLRVIRRVERAPRVLGSVVVRPFRRARGVAYQPARAPSVMESPPNVDTGSDTTALAGQDGDSGLDAPDGQDSVFTSDRGVLDESDYDGEFQSESHETRKKRERMHKKLRKNAKGKKGGKGKRRDVPTEELDQISDAPPTSAVASA
jgi:hypothetical protein